MSDIVWLASYPKSGNTWLRVLLANLTHEGDDPVDINALESSGASSRALFDGFAGTEASDLSEETIERLRPRVYERLAQELAESDGAGFVKVHDAWTCNTAGEPLFSAGAGRRVVYVIRNPLDVVVSFAHFRKRSIDHVIENMCRNKASLGGRGDRLNLQLRQRLLTWSGHVESWVDRSGLDVEVVRYEDMKRRPVETFSRVAQFVGHVVDRLRIEQAVARSSFDQLRAQERTHGFRERGRSAAFFRRGEIGSWRLDLTPAQVERVISHHREVMTRFGYLTAAGIPTDESTVRATDRLGSCRTP